MQEMCDVGRIVDGDADKFHAYGPILAAQGNKIRYFLATRRAPAGPEIQYDDLPTPLRLRLPVSLRIRKTELPLPGDCGRSGRFGRIACLCQPDSRCQRSQDQMMAILQFFLLR